MLVAGDIGGTKTLLAIYESSERARTPVLQLEYRTADYTALDVMVREFLATSHCAVRAACFDVAGPVIDGRAHLTNLPWTVDAAALRAELALEEVFLLNDLQATAYAAPRLRPEELHTINIGKRNATGPIAVIAPGTGLGEAFLVWTNGCYLACSSEGGHASFAPTDRRQAALWDYLSRRFGHVSVERVCSGLGIANIYDFLRDADPASEIASFAAQLARETDRTPLIVRAGLAVPVSNPLAATALDLFVAALADEAGNLALKVLSTGGVYLAGGIPRRVLAKLTDGRFLQAFIKKGRFEETMGTLPVHVVMTEAALLGAAQYGLDRLAERAIGGRFGRSASKAVAPATLGPCHAQDAPNSTPPGDGVASRWERCRLDALPRCADDPFPSCQPAQDQCRQRSHPRCRRGKGLSRDREGRSFNCETALLLPIVPCAQGDSKGA